MSPNLTSSRRAFFCLFFYSSQHNSDAKLWKLVCFESVCIVQCVCRLQRKMLLLLSIQLCLFTESMYFQLLNRDLFYLQHPLLFKLIITTILLLSSKCLKMLVMVKFSTAMLSHKCACKRRIQNGNPKSGMAEWKKKDKSAAICCQMCKNHKYFL